MRRLIATTFLSLDGVMQGPGGPEEDPSNGFPYGGWSVSHWDDARGAAMAKIMENPFDLVLGRRTYELFAAYWPGRTDEEGGGPLNRATKYVASRGTPEPTWRPTVLLSGDAADSVADLKRGDGPELQVHGSGDLLQTLFRAGLVDEFHVWTFPVLLGRGKRLFEPGLGATGLTVADTIVSTTGVVIATYRPAGPVVTGSF